MQNKYFFVGTEAEVDGVRLLELGQEVSFTPEQEQQVFGGQTQPALVAESVWEGIGFTEQELSLYKWPGNRPAEPKADDTSAEAGIARAFWAKLRKAWALVGKESI
jgi:hypothetical protein